MRFVRIPADRLGALIGPRGAVRKQIERRLAVQLHVDSERGEVGVGEPPGKEGADPLAVMKGENVCRAIGRGFSPEHAFKLFSDDFYLTVLDIHDYAGKRPAHVRRLKGRVVGTGGKTRHHIEELTGALISIYGHTVAIIGDIEATENAKHAVDMLLEGAEHATVYRVLETRRREARMADLM